MGLPVKVNSVVSVKISDTWTVLDGVTNVELNDEATTQESKYMGTVYARNTVTYHSVNATITADRIPSDPAQEYLIQHSEGKVGSECVVEVKIESADGYTRSGSYNVAVTNSGISGAADELGQFECELTLANGEYTVTPPSQNSTPANPEVEG